MMQKAGQIIGDTLDTGLALSTAAATGTFDSANELTGFGGTTYTSDADGNRLSQTSSAGTTQYTWDARGRLQAISAPSGAVTSFVYDPAGQMIQQSVSSAGQTTIQQYIVDDAQNIVSVQQSGSNATTVLDGRGPDDILATVQGGSPVFPLADQVGSEGAFTDGSGNVVGREFYEPFGASTTSGAVSLYQFTGMTAVSGGIYYDHARFYDSTTGRFLSADPLGLPGGGANFYQYAASNPIGAFDPTGLVDLNLDDPSDAAAPYAAQYNTWFYFSVAAHGADWDPNHVWTKSNDPNEQGMTVQQVGDKIIAAGWKPGTPIEADICFGTKGGNNSFDQQLAQYLANKSGSDVKITGSNDEVTWVPHSFLFWSWVGSDPGASGWQTVTASPAK